MSQNTLNRFVLAARHAVGLEGGVNLLVTSSAAVRSLNRKFLGKNLATDVLSFPTPASKLSQDARLAGDIAISADVAIQNALRLGHSAAQEVKILALHGILHLAGFDHERDNGRMARKEASLREKLGLPSGLIERANQPRKKALQQRKSSQAGAWRIG